MNDSTADPTIEVEAIRAPDGGEPGDPMVAVEDVIQAYIEHQDARGRDTAVLLSEVSERKKALSSPVDPGERGIQAKGVPGNDSLKRALGAWIERNRSEGKFGPLPREICNVLDAAAKEYPVPLSAVSQ